MWSKFFPFRVDSFSEGRQNNFDRVTYPEGVSVSFKAVLILTQSLN